MDKTSFLYWLQGFFELRDDNTPLTPKQVQMILVHLAIVSNAADDKYLNWLGRILNSIRQSNYQNSQLTSVIQATLPGNFHNITSRDEVKSDPFRGFKSVPLSQDLSKIRVC